MSEKRRQRRERERQVTFKGFVSLYHHEDPVPYRGTGDLYVNSNDNILRVSIDGKWHQCPNGKKEALRKLIKFCKTRKRTL